MTEKADFEKSCDFTDKSDALFKIINQGENIIVEFKKPCMSNVQALSETSIQIKKYVQDNHPKKIVFDFTIVKFFSSQLLGLLLDIRNTAQEYGGKVMISGINPQLHRVFKITNLDKIFSFFIDWHEAVNAEY